MAVYETRKTEAIHVGILVVGLALIPLAGKLPSMSPQALTLQLLGYGLLIYFGIWLSRRLGGRGRKQP